MHSFILWNSQFQSLRLYLNLCSMIHVYAYTDSKHSATPMSVGENFETGDSLLITDVLRTYVEKIPSERYCQKRKVIDMLREKGLDYEAVKIPQVIVDRIKNMYPANWKYILTIY